MEKDKVIAVIDMKSFYSSIECVERGLDPFFTPLAVTDISRKEASIVLSVTPYLKSKGVPSVCRRRDLPKNIEGMIYATPRMELYVKKSAEIADKVLERLEFSLDERKRYQYLIINHDTPIQKAKMDSSISDSSLLEKLFQVQCCDGLAHNPTKLEKRRKYLEEAYHYLHPNAPEDRVRTWVNKTPVSSKILEKRR